MRQTLYYQALDTTGSISGKHTAQTRLDFLFSPVTVCLMTGR